MASKKPAKSRATVVEGLEGLESVVLDAPAPAGHAVSVIEGVLIVDTNALERLSTVDREAAVARARKVVERL